ncbi:hypothetical protein VIGAN_01009800 [Vigna angularis var. angularis]|uniref:Uncharacterized protein n=1 Tax=Vigna angularis var. angularis TaxID=157739 RepID=A0A0S3QWE9_PHAAN|nr:hypothetical protein VIGAN_01009800 [Vigna angularis var. angularis]
MMICIILYYIYIYIYIEREREREREREGSDQLCISLLCALYASVITFSLHFSFLLSLHQLLMLYNYTIQDFRKQIWLHQWIMILVMASTLDACGCWTLRVICLSMA